MKKYITIITAVAIALSLCGCSAKNDTSHTDTETSITSDLLAPADSQTPSDETSAADVTETTAETSTSAPDSVTTPSEETTGAYTEITTSAVTEATTEPTTAEVTKPTETTTTQTTSEKPKPSETSAPTTTAPEDEKEPATEQLTHTDLGRCFHSDYTITEIFNDYFLATSVYPFPYTYTVYYKLPEKYSVGDNVVIFYSSYDEDADYNIFITPSQVEDSDFVPDPNVAYKPVIYLYPEKTTDVTVKLDFNGELMCTYPTYDRDLRGWHVTAKPDGSIINKADGNEYSYLFWDGKSNAEYDFSKGFVVKGSDTAEFLREKLTYLGLTAREYNEFIVFWLPLMQNNEYNLITFQGERYTESAVLDITPKPDSILRVFMAYVPLEAPIEIEEQELDTFERKGFTVVEWGGAMVRTID